MGVVDSRRQQDAMRLVRRSKSHAAYRTDYRRRALRQLRHERSFHGIEPSISGGPISTTILAKAAWPKMRVDIGFDARGGGYSFAQTKRVASDAAKWLAGSAVLFIVRMVLRRCRAGHCRGFLITFRPLIWLFFSLAFFVGIAQFALSRFTRGASPAAKYRRFGGKIALPMCGWKA